MFLGLFWAFGFVFWSVLKGRSPWEHEWQWVEHSSSISCRIQQWPLVSEKWSFETCLSLPAAGVLVRICCRSHSCIFQHCRRRHCHSEPSILWRLHHRYHGGLSWSEWGSVYSKCPMHYLKASTGPTASWLIRFTWQSTFIYPPYLVSIPAHLLNPFLSLYSTYSICPTCCFSRSSKPSGLCKFPI